MHNLIMYYINIKKKHLKSTEFPVVKATQRETSYYYLHYLFICMFIS